MYEAAPCQRLPGHLYPWASEPSRPDHYVALHPGPILQLYAALVHPGYRPAHLELGAELLQYLPCQLGGLLVAQELDRLLKHIHECHS